MVVAHQVVVLCMRYLLENLTEQQILAIDAEGDVANCGVTEYRYDPDAGPSGAMLLERYNFVAPMVQAGVAVTAETDMATAAR